VNISRLAFLAITLLFVSCANHEGWYEPDCIAYEGDKIELRDGRFEWQRFTDQREVDQNGNVAEPFPDYPKTGTYTLSDSRIQLITKDGTALGDWFLVVHAGKRYLLTPKQHNAFTESNDMPRCVLKLTGIDR